MKFLICFLFGCVFFLDSEFESEDLYYGIFRNNNNKRRKFRGIFKIIFLEYVFINVCIYIYVLKKFFYI